VRAQVSRHLPPPVGRLIDRVITELGPATAGVPGTLVVGVDDPMIPEADVSRPLAVMPARGPGRPTPWGAAVVGAADAVILLDPSEALPFGDALADRALLVAGLPAPVARPAGTGLDPGDASAEIRAAWARETAAGASADAGVAWVSGRGIAPLAAALEAWGAGRAVVVLPQTDDHELLSRGRVLRAHSVAEAMEATRFLFANPPLAQALGERGREVALSLPPVRRVALRVLEGMELARQSAQVTAA